MTPGKAIAWFLACFVAGGTIGGVLVRPVAHNTKLVRCMTYLPNMKDSELKRWCLKQSERMP